MARGEHEVSMNLNFSGKCMNKFDKIGRKALEDRGPLATLKVVDKTEKKKERKKNGSKNTHFICLLCANSCIMTI